MVSYIVISVVSVLLIAIDQITKAIISSKIAYAVEEIVVIENFFDIVHWHNTGAAWGIFSDKTWILTVFTVISVCFVLFCYACAKPAFLKLSLGLIVAGAVGNLIDRIRLGYVIDFLSFDNLFGYSFPAFNVADICITSGAIGIIIYIIFMVKKTEPFRKGTVLERFFAEESV